MSLSSPLGRLSRRSSAWVLAFLVPVVLACSGLPIPGAGTGGGEEPSPDAANPEPEEPGGEEPVAADPAPEGSPKSADTLFPDLDAAEAPPFERGAVKCPAPTMTIRHPKGARLSVYCATGSGVRSGPYTEWQRNTLVLSATNVDGKFEGNWIRWEDGHKVEQQVYVAGQAVGDHAEWDVKGQLLVRGRMVDGKKDGRFVERKVEGGAIVPGGACYEAGAETWRTADEGELVTRTCGTDAVAEG